MRPVDLTMTISEDLPAFPGSPGPHLVPWEKIGSDGYNLELLFCSSHTGTHMDAPYHFARRGVTIDRIPVGRFVTEAVLVRLRKGPGRAITKREIARFEEREGIPDGAAVVFETGWSERLGDGTYFEKNPGLGADAAEYLASRGVGLVGIDSPSVDPGGKTRFPAHRILSRNNMLIVENLTNLDRIDGSRFRLVVLPLKLAGASGSPVRAVAI